MKFDEDYIRIMEATCLHEAGHVVSAFVLGFEVTYAIVHAKKSKTQFDVSGYTELVLASLQPFKDPEEAQQAMNEPEILRIRAIQAAAGPIAEAFLYPDKQELHQGAKTDLLFIRRCAVITLNSVNLLNSSSESDKIKLQNFVNNYQQKCAIEAEKLLTAHLSAIAAVTDYLLKYPNMKISGGILQPLAKLTDW